MVHAQTKTTRSATSPCVPPIPPAHISVPFVLLLGEHRPHHPFSLPRPSPFMRIGGRGVGGAWCIRVQTRRFGLPHHRVCRPSPQPASPPCLRFRRGSTAPITHFLLPSSSSFPCIPCASGGGEWGGHGASGSRQDKSVCRIAVCAALGGNGVWCDRTPVPCAPSRCSSPRCLCHCRLRSAPLLCLCRAAADAFLPRDGLVGLPQHHLRLPLRSAGSR